VGCARADAGGYAFLEFYMFLHVQCSVVSFQWCMVELSGGMYCRAEQECTYSRRVPGQIHGLYAVIQASFKIPDVAVFARGYLLEIQ
jgi:hypothetical protein